jgi:hypothetical protein
MSSRSRHAAWNERPPEITPGSGGRDRSFQEAACGDGERPSLR